MVIAYLSGMGKRDAALRPMADSLGAQYRDCSSTLLGKLCIFFGLDAMTQLQQCIQKKRPFVYMDHAYFERGYEARNFRVCVNHVHQTGLLDVPGDRAKGVTLYPWKKGKEVIVLAPSQKICQALGISGHWAEETALFLRRYTDRPIRIKHKGAGLLGELKDCHAVVGLSSVAEVEAARFGVPVFAGEHSPARPIAESDLTRIETPLYPDREPWLRTLSYSQWHTDEMSAGKTMRHLERCYGDFYIRGTPDRDQQLA